MKKLRVTRGGSQDENKTMKKFRRTEIGRDDEKLSLERREIGKSQTLEVAET